MGPEATGGRPPTGFPWTSPEDVTIAPTGTHPAFRLEDRLPAHCCGQQISGSVTDDTRQRLIGGRHDLGEVGIGVKRARGIQHDLSLVNRDLWDLCEVATHKLIWPVQGMTCRRRRRNDGIATAPTGLDQRLDLPA